MSWCHLATLVSRAMVSVMLDGPRVKVGEVGKISERSRFKRVGPHSARESVLISAGFDADEGEWLPRATDGCERLGEGNHCD